MSVCYAKTVEPIEMLFGANSRVGPRNCGAMGCLLVPLGEYDKMVCAAAAVRAVATITCATYYYFASECGAKYCNQRVCASVYCVYLFASMSQNRHVHSKPSQIQTLRNFLRLRFGPNFDKSAIHYLFPVLWMTS